MCHGTFGIGGSDDGAGSLTAIIDNQTNINLLVFLVDTMTTT